MNGRTDRQTWIGKAHLALYLVSFVIPFHPSFVPFRWQWELRQISVTPYRLMENRNWQHTTATGDSSHSISGRASSHLLWYEHRDCTAGFMYVCGLAVILIQNLHFPYIVVVAIFHDWLGCRTWDTRNLDVRDSSCSFLAGKWGWSCAIKSHWIEWGTCSSVYMTDLVYSTRLLYGRMNGFDGWPDEWINWWVGGWIDLLDIQTLVKTKTTKH